MPMPAPTTAPLPLLGAPLVLTRSPTRRRLVHHDGRKTPNPASVKVPERATRSTMAAADMRASAGSASVRIVESSGARRTSRARPARSSSIASGVNGERPRQTSIAGTIKLASTVSCARSSTVQSPPAPSGSCTRRHTRMLPNAAAPDATHSATSLSSARSLSVSRVAGSQGTGAVSESSHAASTLRRPDRRATSAVPASTSRAPARSRRPPPRGVAPLTLVPRTNCRRTATPRLSDRLPPAVATTTTVHDRRRRRKDPV